MNSKVTYLASRSRAVYEVSLIEQFAETHERMQKQQALAVFGMWIGFTFLATLAFLLPAIFS